MFSPTGYFAHFTTTFRKPDGEQGDTLVDSFPVAGYTDTALIIDEDGTVKTVGALLDELREGGDTPDEEGATWTVCLAVNAAPGE